MNEADIRASFRKRMLVDVAEHNKSVLREMRRRRENEEASWVCGFQEKLDAAWASLKDRERRDAARGYHVGPDDPDWHR
jgi:hypothetical protein